MTALSLPKLGVAAPALLRAVTVAEKALPAVKGAAVTPLMPNEAGEAMKLVLPDMLAQDYGHIVNVASMSAKMTLPGVAVYTASKFGVASLSRSVRSEIMDSNVTITTVMPSAVQTDLTAGLDIRGVPKSKPEDVAAEIVSSCHHCKPEITVPRWLNTIGAVEELLPEKVGSFIKKLAGAQNRLLHDTPQSRAYQDRVSRS